MIIGLGVDLVNVSRFDSWSDNNFSRVFTNEELSYARSFDEPYEKFAKIWAVKEAVVKAIGTGFANGVAFKDISLISSAGKMPKVKVSGTVLDIIKSKCENFNIHVSISDDGGFSVAVVIIESI